jgi:hypothetical protein
VKGTANLDDYSGDLTDLSGFVALPDRRITNFPGVAFGDSRRPTC